MLNTLIKAPKAGQVFGYGTSTTHQVYETPTVWIGQKIVLEAIDYDLYVNFGAVVGIEVSATGVSTLSTNTLTVGATTGVCIPAGTALEIQLATADTYFAIEATGSGAWRGWVSLV